MKYEIVRSFVWDEKEGGTGIKYNLNEPVPKGILKDKKLLDRFLKKRVIAPFDENGKRISTEFDFVTLGKEEVESIIATNDWKELIDRLTYSDYSQETLKKFKAKLMNMDYANKESVVDVITKQLQTSTNTQGRLKDEKKTTSSKR